VLGLGVSPLGCSRPLPEPSGANEEIYALVDSADLEALRVPLGDTFEKVLRTPQEEKVYRVRVGDISTFRRHRHHLRKSILLAAPFAAVHPIAELLRSLLEPGALESARQGGPAVFWRPDVWARDQVVLIVTGEDLAQVVDNLRAEGDRLYRAIETARNRRVSELIFRYGEREDIEQHLAESYGWRLRVPSGYRIMEEHPDSGFVVLARQQPNRWLFVYWQDGVSPGILGADWCIAKRDEVTNRFFGGDRVVAHCVSTSQTEFAGRLAVVLEGLWENTSPWSGGPFRSYAFTDAERGRLYFVDVGVFSPNKQKETYLRQVDLMARTFSLEGDVAQN